MGPLVACINYLLMAFANLWNGHASFPEMVLLSSIGAFSMTTWFAMMAPTKAKAKAKAKGKGKSKAKADKKRKAATEDVDSSDNPDEFDPEAMTPAEKKKLMSNLAGQLTNAKNKLAKHTSGQSVLSERQLDALKAKIEHCEKYSKLGQGDPEKEKLLLEFRQKSKGNAWGSYSNGFQKAEIRSEAKKQGYGTKFFLLLKLLVCLVLWLMCLKI